MSNRLTKKVEIYTKIVSDKPTFLITYQTDGELAKEVIREQIRILNRDSDYRYYGETPILFVRREHLDNIGVLNLAKLLKDGIDNNKRVLTELALDKRIRRTLKALDGNLVRMVYSDDYKNVVLRRPSNEFITFSDSIFDDVVAYESDK